MSAITHLQWFMGGIAFGHALDVIDVKVYMWQRQVIFSRMFYFIGLHVMAIVAVFKLENVSYKTVMLHVVYAILSQIGVTAGMHRLWTHESYKANIWLQYVLLYFATCAQELSVIDWVKWHRAHHKHSDTSADPHNVNDGFWFAHVGWLITKDTKAVREAIKNINYDDIIHRRDMILQQKYYPLWLFLGSICAPVAIAWTWNDAYNSYLLYYIRTVYVLNSTFLVNSAAHTWGYKPYTNTIAPAENRWVSLIAVGEGWHNFHHTYSKDYRAAESILDMNITGLLLALLAKFGLVTDRKVAKAHYKGPYKSEVTINNKSYYII